MANVRNAFKKGGGVMGNNGSVSFMFERMATFRLKPDGLDAEELELELIDAGLEELGESESEKGEPQLVIRCAFNDFGTMQAAIEAKGITPISSESEFIPQNTMTLGTAEAEAVLKLIGRLEEDDDVQKVFHTLA